MSMKGFTLIELIMVVAILGIISAVAVPAYSGYISTAKRSSAKSVLLEASSRQENMLINDRSYSATMTDLGYANNPLYVDKKGNPTTQANSTYKISVVAATTACPITSCFVLEAVPQNNLASDAECATFTISSLGVKTATGTKGSACW